MVTNKDARNLLNWLSKQNLIQLQEVPRGTGRVNDNSKSYFLWYVDRRRRRDALLASCYQLLSNLHTRREEEIVKRADLIHKLERTDVQEDPALLSDLERTQLEELEWKIEALDVAIQRADEDVFVLRDLPGLIPELTVS
jgi:predicted ArsR family transcriptional regulator